MRLGWNLEPLGLTGLLNFLRKLPACGGGGESQFFISHIKPHKPMSPSTVLWLVQVLAMAGIDMEGFHAAPSTRSLLSSLAEVTGVSLTDIIKQGHWSQTSTFQKFYRKNAKNMIPIFNQESSTSSFEEKRLKQ